MKQLPFCTSLLLTAVMGSTGFLSAAEEAAVVTEVTVQVVGVIRTSLLRSITAYGRVEPAPPGNDQVPAYVKLSPAVAGVIAEANAVEGQAVARGDVLFKLDSRAVDADVLAAEQAVEFASEGVERQRQLISAEGTSRRLVMEAEQTMATAKAQLASALVRQSLLVGRSPISGTLVGFAARVGEAADSSTVLAEIADLDRIVATVNVPRSEVGDLKIGQAAKVSGTDGNAGLASRVVFVSPQVDPATGTVAVRLELPKGCGLRNGAFVTARIVIEEHAGILAVPDESVYTDYEGRSTLSVVEGDTATKMQVKTGIRDGGLIEVEGDGISEGTTVVTVGSYALPQETRIHITAPPEKEESR